MYRKANMSVLEVPEGIRISDRKINYIYDRYLTSWKLPKTKKKIPRSKEYKAYNRISGKIIIGTSRELGAKLFRHLTVESAISSISGLFHKNFKTVSQWYIFGVNEDPETYFKNMGEGK